MFSPSASSIRRSKLEVMPTVPEEGTSPRKQPTNPNTKVSHHNGESNPGAAGSSTEAEAQSSDDAQSFVTATSNISAPSIDDDSDRTMTPGDSSNSSDTSQVTVINVPSGQPPSRDEATISQFPQYPSSGDAAYDIENDAAESPLLPDLEAVAHRAGPSLFSRGTPRFYGRTRREKMLWCGIPLVFGALGFGVAWWIVDRMKK